MNKKELKVMLKPLIKECIKEVMFEEGVLSGIVSEVVQGMGQPTLVEAQASTPPQEGAFTQIRAESASEQKAQLNEQKQKLLDAIGNEAYNGVNLFEGTRALTSAPPKPGASPAPQGPLSGVAPGDQGIDITSLVGNVGTQWSAHMKSQKERD